MPAAANAIWSPDAMRLLDSTAIHAFGIPGHELMLRAGRAVVTAAEARWPGARRWLVLCGGGNNGGDGYVIARLALKAGHRVEVCALSDPAALKGDAATTFREFMADGGRLVPFEPALLGDAALVVDAIFGTGLARPVAGEARRVIDAVNAAGRPVVAVDVPSGLDAATGHPAGAAIRAALTVTFVGRKLGLHLGEGPAFAGEVVFADLDIPPAASERSGLAGREPLRLFTAAELPGLLPPRRATTHKGDCGHVLVVGGNQGMAGAVRLAGEAALRTGAGLVSVATRPAHAALVPLARPEVMCHGVDGGADLAPLLQRATVVAVGPGLGRDAWARDLLATVLAAGLPLVLDADALNLLPPEAAARSDWVLTPHPGEAGRLLGTSAGAVQHDRLGALAELRRRFGGTVLLKGSNTLVAGSAAGPGWVIGAGNPGMATAGMGDVLTGVVAGLLAQFGATAPMADLTAAAAFVHAAAGDVAARSGQRGLIASDVLANLRPWLNP